VIEKMVFGSILAKISEFRLDAADGQSAIVRNTTLTRAALRIVGVPHMGLRIRAGLILGEIRRHRPQTIIDAGSGNGLYTLEFAARGYMVHGIELNQDKVSRVERYAREAGLANASLRVADLTKLARVTQQADLVVCSDVLEHIPDDNSAVFALHALTRPGGILVLTVPRVSPFAARVENSFDHVRIGYTEESLCAMLESAGFQLLKTGQFFKMFGRMAWAADRSLRYSTALKALMFWPLFLFAKLDTLIPDDRNAGGILVVARAPTDEKRLQAPPMYNANSSI
jgi:2-polyprenyl-3-methyl-5-hydroxy-6-metoxy-1,4-benzoquinol methylase